MNTDTYISVLTLALVECKFLNDRQMFIQLICKICVCLLSASEITNDNSRHKELPFAIILLLRYPHTIFLKRFIFLIEQVKVCKDSLQCTSYRK